MAWIWHCSTDVVSVRAQQLFAGGAATSASLAADGPPYEPRRPEDTLLHQTVRDELESFLTRARERDQPAPRFVEHELRAYLRCGILAHGFLRLRCDECKHERLVPFSCKRQWVLTLPYALRYRCAYDARLTSEVLRAFLRALFAELRRRARRELRVQAEQCGAVTFVQRFGSALNLNLHFHTLALDGAFLYEPHPGRAPEFIELASPTGDDVARVLVGTARRLRRLLETRAEGDEDVLARDEPLLALLSEASLRTRIATGPEAGQPWRRLGDRVEVEPGSKGNRPGDADSPVARHAELSLHAAVCVPARDRRRLERLCRYVARPPLAHDRLEARPDGQLALRLKTKWRDGTTHILMERRDLIDRLAPLIPPPRAHQVRYHGILAPGASLRERVVPTAPVTPPSVQPPSTSSGASAPLASAPNTSHASPAPSEPTSRRSRMRWAALLQRVFAVDALRCPGCGSTLRLLAAIEDAAVAQAILHCLGLLERAPPTAPARPEPSAAPPDFGEAFDFDQTPVYEES